MRVKTEEELVVGESAAKLRKTVIEEISNPENMARKNESFRRHLCNKDQTSIFVIEELLKQFDDTTVREMAYSISNVSIGKKIIDKLARVYAQGVQRTSDNEANTQKVQDVAKLMDLNRVMKRVDKYLRSQRNTLLGILPCPYSDNGVTKYEIKLQPLQPHLYDVVENYYDREKPMFVILSNYKRVLPARTAIDPAKAGRGLIQAEPKNLSDGKDEVIADKPEDQGANEDQYIWWSKHYHFTTNCKGEILSSADDVQQTDISNPIIELPFVNFAMDQDGAFWAEGAQDIYDGSVHVNCMITNAQHIGVTQGYGQFWMRGKGLPKMVKAGVNKSILLDYEKDDPTPEIGFASSNPKLQELKEQVVMYVALLLTTNNLSTKAVAAELNNTKDFSSGISMIIDKSESIEDVQDQRDVFQQNEPKVFKLIQKWQAAYKTNLTEEFQSTMLPDKFDVNLKFNDATPIMAESEKLANLQLRKDLGINTAIELLQIDDPSLDDEDAEEKLLKILEDKIKNKEFYAITAPPAAPGTIGPDGKPLNNNTGTPPTQPTDKGTTTPPADKPNADQNPGVGSESV